ncbi:MAG: sigma factor [Planctomycetota bacterium]
MPEDRRVESRLSRISTVWAVLQKAHEVEGEPPNSHAVGERQAAQALLVECYGPAVRRYLLALTRDENETDDLWQRFMLELVRGGFKNASPEKGRFRSYVKASLIHLVSKQRRRSQREPAFTQQHLEAEDAPQLVSADRTGEVFDQHWKEQLIDRTWNALKDAQPRYHRVLRLRTEFPEVAVADLVERLSTSEDSMGDVAFRKTLSRARDRFAGLLIDEVGRSLKTPTEEAVREELADLGLLHYLDGKV